MFFIAGPVEATSLIAIRQFSATFWALAGNLFPKPCPQDRYPIWLEVEFKWDAGRMCLPIKIVGKVFIAILGGISMAIILMAGLVYWSVNQVEEESLSVLN